MSGLLKRELEIEFAEIERQNSGFSGKKKKGTKLVEKLPSNRHGIKKQMKRLKDANNRPKYGPSVKKFKFSFLELQSKQNLADTQAAKIEAGVQKLLNFSNASKASSSSVANAKDVVQHHQKTQRHYVPKSREFMEKFSKKKQKVEDATGTVFTEEDFEKFAQEYFVNSKPINSSTLVTKSKFNDE
jgi:hypothetical protein